MRKQLLQIDEDIRLAKMTTASLDNLLHIIEQQNKILEEVRDIIPAIINLVPTGIEFTYNEDTTIIASTKHREYLIQYANNLDMLTVIDIMAEENSFVDDSAAYVLVGYSYGEFEVNRKYIEQLILNYQDENDYL